MKRRNKLIICLVLAPILAGGLVWGAVTLAQSTYGALGEAGKPLLEDDGTPAAWVNGQMISQAQVETALQTKKLEGNKTILSQEDALDMLIHYEILKQEAAKLGYTEDGEAADAYVKETRAFYDEIRKKGDKATQAQRDELQRLEDYIDGLGVEEDAYWQLARELYLRAARMAWMRSRIDGDERTYTDKLLLDGAYTVEYAK